MAQECMFLFRAPAVVAVLMLVEVVAPKNAYWKDLGLILRAFEDKKGWKTMEFRPGPGCVKYCTFNVHRWGRKLQIEFKGQSLRVHVNPTGGNFDEWETPIGNNDYLLVRSPLECPAENKRAKGDTASEERVGPAKNASSVSSAGCEEKKSEDDGIPPAKRQKTNSQTPGTASAKKKGPEDTDKPTPLPAKGRKEKWSICREASRSNWRVRTGLTSTRFHYRDYGDDEDLALAAARVFFDEQCLERSLPRKGQA